MDGGKPMKCGDKEWMHCRVEKMGCKGCHYDKFNNLEIANEFANLTFIYGGKIAFTSEQIKRYQKAVKRLIDRNEQLEKYYQCERNLLDSYIPKSKVKEKITQLKMNANYDWMYKYDYQDVVKILQELLGGE